MVQCHCRAASPQVRDLGVWGTAWLWGLGGLEALEAPEVLEGRQGALAGDLMGVQWEALLAVHWGGQWEDLGEGHWGVLKEAQQVQSWRVPWVCWGPARVACPGPAGSPGAAPAGCGRCSGRP